MHNTIRATYRLVKDDKGENFAELFRASHARTSMLIARVHNQEIRSEAKAIKALCSGMKGRIDDEQMDSLGDDGHAFILEASKMFDRFNEKTGKCLRTLDDFQEGGIG